MQIKSISVDEIQIPLLKPYVSALRRVDNIKDIVVTIRTSNGLVGYGSATATPAITGDTYESIISAIINAISPKILGRNLLEFENVINLTYSSIEKNFSAKAAVDIALHDLMAKYYNVPLYQFLGGSVNRITTDMTIGLNTIDEMVDNAKNLVSNGVKTLKIKAGMAAQDDLAAIQAIRNAVGENIRLCIDVNQQWNVADAVKIIHEIEKLNLNICMIEQPTAAGDLVGLKYVRDHVDSTIFADESCFSPDDAMNIISNDMADGIVVKLMKSGGLYAANTIYQIAKKHDFPCMVGCMLESPISIAAMASFSVSKKDIAFVDLGTLVRLKYNPIVGGMQLSKSELILSDQPGLGIDSLGEIKMLHEIKCD
ncbi:MAG: dipeptide epimerase [Coxiellaceae bacterium]|nr:dipeptide epimerase [Coxiellaceae bacterium]